MVDEQAAIRAKALTGLGVALVLGIGGWVFLRQATDAGIARLARIDTARAGCTTLWRQARSSIDSAHVDAMALPDTIDPRSASALKRCGDLHAVPSNTVPGAREMSGEPMPRGLR